MDLDKCGCLQVPTRRTAPVKCSTVRAHFLQPRNGSRDRALWQNDRRKFLNSLPFFFIARNVTEGPATRAGVAYLKNRRSRENDGSGGENRCRRSCCGEEKLKSTWRGEDKNSFWPLVFAHFGIKTHFFLTLWELSSQLFMENGALSTRWRVAKSDPS